MPRVAVCAPDLIDQSKIRAALAGADDDLVFVRPPGLLDAVVADGTVEVVVVDVSRAGALDAIRAVASHRADRPRALRVLGFGSHVDRDGLAAALVAGCDQVLARSAFFGGLPGVLDS